MQAFPARIVEPLMELTPFSTVNQYLKERLIHPSRYTCRKYSFLKVFQHGLSFALNKSDFKLIKNYLRFPYSIQLLIYFLKSLRKSKPVGNVSFKKTVILEPGRIVSGKDNKWHSIYFDKVCHTIGRENLSILSIESKTVLDHDYTLKDLTRTLPYPDANEREMLREIISVLRNASEGVHFTPYELKHLRSAMHIFFEEFRFYYHAFKNQKVETLLFICHYHREGMIAAMKLLNIKCVEFQHGLIATNDLYYVYHEQFAGSIKNSFFPDQLVVYGPYWKRILQSGCEFKSKKILIGGDYLYRQNEQKIVPVTKENIILVCAQKNLHQDYVQYGKSLAKHLQKHPDWKAIIKLHPLERNKQAYEVLKELNIQIVGVEAPLDELLGKCRIQVSIYSTTFYDALGFGVVNYSLQEFGAMSDYASDMISEGVAIPIMENEDPIAKYLENENISGSLLSRSEVYSEYNENLIRSLTEPAEF